MVNHCNMIHVLQKPRGSGMVPRAYTVRMSPTLNGSSEIQCFECSDVITIRDGIMSVFYPGLLLAMYTSVQIISTHYTVHVHLAELQQKGFSSY